MALTCTPYDLVAQYPCLKCASTTELIAFVALSSYALQNRGEHGIADMLADGKCFKCASVHQMLEMIAATLIAIAIANGYFDNADEILQTAKCLTCADPAVIRGIIVKAQCDNINAQWPLQ